MPPNLREATGVERCASCVHFKPDVIEGEGSVCVKYNDYPVHADDVCDSYETVIDPRTARLEERLAEAVEAREKAAAAGDRDAFISARAREQKLRIDLKEVKSSAYPSLERVPGKQNWVDKAGGLPKYIERIAKHLHYEKGKPIGQAIAIAVNAVKKMCASGDVNFPGKQNVNAGSRAQACAAVAQWEAKKARGKMKETVELVESAEVDDLSFAQAFAIAKEAEEWKDNVGD